MKMTTRTNIICPKCDAEIKIETKGLFGGLIKQWMIHTLLNETKRRGGEAICHECKHEFEIGKEIESK